MKWFACRHINGSKHLKRYHSQESHEEASGSDFVDEITEPFEATNRTEANERASELLQTEDESDFLSRATAGLSDRRAAE